MRLVNELDAIKNKTHKTGGKKMKKKKVFALMMAATLALSLAGSEDLRQVIQNHQDLQTAVL